MWDHMYGYGWGGMGMIGMSLFWILLIVGIAILVKSCGICEKNALEKTALDILKERYARGEIEREEFEQTKHDLEN